MWKYLRWSPRPGLFSICSSLRIWNSNVTSLFPPPGTCSSSGILKVHFPMTLPGVFLVPLVYSGIQTQRFDPGSHFIQTHGCRSPIFPHVSCTILSASLLSDLTAHSSIQSSSHCRMLHIFLCIRAWLGSVSSREALGPHLLVCW